MNQMKTEAKEVIGRAVTECQQTWPLTQQDLLEILISLAGDIATGQRLLTPVAADGVHTWTCPHCSTLNYGAWPFCYKCRR